MSAASTEATTHPADLLLVFKRFRRSPGATTVFQLHPVLPRRRRNAGGATADVAVGRGFHLVTARLASESGR